MRAALLGSLLGTLVVLDPFVTAYLLRDFAPLRYLPYVLSLSLALAVGAMYVVRAFVPGLAGAVINDYYRSFPLLFLLAYQLNGVKAGPLDPTEVVIGIYLFVFLAGLFARSGERFVSTPVNMLNIGLGVCILLSLVSQFDPFGLLKSPKPFVVFFLLVNFLARDQFALTFLRALVVLAVLSALFGLVQELAWITTQEVLSPLPKENLKRMFEETSAGSVLRVPAMMVSYRSLALFLAMATMLILSALLWPHQLSAARRRWLIVGLLIILPALGLTFAKDILLGTALAIGLLLVLRRPVRIVHLALIGLAGAMAVAIAAAMLPGQVDTLLDLTHTIPRTEQERIRLDRDSIEGALHGPYLWTGRGVASGARYTAHVLGWPAHNAFILVTAELGLAGLALYLSIYGLIVARVIALNLVAAPGPYLPVARALLATMLIVLIGAQFEASYLDVFVWTIFATIEAVWFLVRRQPAPPTEDTPMQRAR